MHDYDKLWVGMAPTGHGPDDWLPIRLGPTKQQIEWLTGLELDVYTSDGTPVEWESFYDPDGVNSHRDATSRPVFNHIIADRRERVNTGKNMTNRPPFAVVTHDSGEIVTRIEYYWGRNDYQLEYDLKQQPEATEQPSYQGV